MNTCLNKPSINECGIIRQVFVVWFASGGDDVSYHGVDSSPCRINPMCSIDGSSPTHFFCFFIVHHEIFNRKLQKCHVIYTITIQWKPGVHIILTWHIACPHNYMSDEKCLLLWLKITLFLLRAQQNVTAPLEILGVSKKLCCATIEQILFEIKRGDESSLRPNQPRSSLYLLNHPDKRRDTHSEWKHYQPNITGDKDVCLIISPIVLQHCPALACNHHRTAPSLNVPRSPCMARRACSAAPVATSCMAAAPAPASSLTPKHKCTGRARKGNAEVS